MTLAMKTVTYPKETYAARLRINSGRVANDGGLYEAERIQAVMTRFLKRCVRDDPSVVIGAVTRVAAFEDFSTGRWWLSAVAPAFRSVDPRDRETLEAWADVPGAHAMQIPRIPRIDP